MIQSRVAVVLVMLLAAMGCGGDHHRRGVTFVGNVTSVSPQQAMLQAPSPRWFAKVESLLLPNAVAQSSCPALHVLACASNGSDPEDCERVDSGDCGFSVSVPADSDGFVGGTVAFVDDQDDDGEHDSGEPTAFLLAALGRLCEGTVVKLDDVAINFTLGTATAASVNEDPDTCANVTPTPIPTPTPYSIAAPLNGPPSTMLAMLYGAGAVGLLLPLRWRRRRR
jgi:hypothetical protein